MRIDHVLLHGYDVVLCVGATYAFDRILRLISRETAPAIASDFVGPACVVFGTVYALPLRRLLSPPKAALIGRFPFFVVFGAPYSSRHPTQLRPAALLEIFQFLAREDLNACVLVSRDWNQRIGCQQELLPLLPAVVKMVCGAGCVLLYLRLMFRGTKAH